MIVDVFLFIYGIFKAPYAFRGNLFGIENRI